MGTDAEYVLTPGEVCHQTPKPEESYTIVDSLKRVYGVWDIHQPFHCSYEKLPKKKYKYSAVNTPNI